jgi:uncharacterized membrane protein
MDPYFIAKWLHILSSTLLFGTGIGTAFQMVMAMQTGRAQTVADVAAAVVRADWLFTTPAGLVQPLTGLWLIHLAGWHLTEPWLLATYALYLLAFLCWAPVLHLQIRIRDLCRAAALSGPGPGPGIPPAAIRLYRIWFALGWPAFAALVAIFWLMITKPGFN